MRTAAEIRRLLESRLAVDPSIVCEALGVGMTALNGAIQRGIVPVINLGPGSKKRPIPSWWVRRQLGIEMEDGKSRPG
jgi:hypothetical protein